jgi:hypothetical protein
MADRPVVSGRPKRKRPPLGDVLLPILGPLDGARIQGGCEHCDAYQTAHQDEPYMWRILVHHDDGCPWWAARRDGR